MGDPEPGQLVGRRLRRLFGQVVGHMPWPAGGGRLDVEQIESVSTRRPGQPEVRVGDAGDPALVREVTLADKPGAIRNLRGELGREGTQLRRRGLLAYHLASGGPSH